MGHSCDFFGVTKSSASDTNSKITIFRSRERSFHFCLMDKSPTDRSHQDEAIIALSIRQKCKFTIRHGCSRRKVTLHHTFHTHMHKYPEIIRLSRIQCTDTICIHSENMEKIFIMLSLVHSNEYHGGQITVILSSFGGDFYWIGSDYCRIARYYSGHYPYSR